MTDFSKNTILFDATSNPSAPDKSTQTKVFLDKNDSKLKRINFDGSIEELTKEQQIKYYETKVEADADQTVLSFTLPNPYKIVKELEVALKGLINGNREEALNAISKVAGNIESWKESQELANSGFDSSISDIENKVSDLIGLIDTKVSQTEFESRLGNISKDLVSIIENVNRQLNEKATKKELESGLQSVRAAIPKLPEPINIVADSTNVTIEKRGNEFGVAVDVPQVVQQVINKGGGTTQAWVKNYVDNAIADISGGGGTLTTLESSGGSILFTPIPGGYNLEVAAGTSAGIQGRYQLSNAGTTFTINHSAIDPLNEFPVASLEVATSGSDLFIVGIHDRLATSFKVTLSGVPSSSDYILWHISSQNSSTTPTIASSGGSIVVTQNGLDFNLEVASAPIATHNDLNGLQGDGTDYYHLNATQFAAISGGLNTLDTRYVNVSGDTMTGKLTVPAFNLQAETKVTSVSGDMWIDADNDGKGIYINIDGYTKQLDGESNTVGPIEKIVLTDNGDGTINAPSIPVYLHSNNDWTGTYRHYHIPSASNLALTDNTVNYLVANYNSGSPIYQVTTDPATINNSDIALIATMSRIGTEIHWIPVDWGLATAIKLNNRQINIRRFERSSGLALSESATRVINIGSGVIWYGSSSNSVSSVVSSSNNADFWYHSAGNWTKSIVSTYNNSQYDNGTNLASLGANDYTVNWVYRYLDGAGLPKIAYVLGTSYSTLAQAQASVVPTISTLLERTSILVGRIIIRNGQSTATQIDSAFTQAFAGSVVTDHNNLSGLQGGTTSQYYHLTSSQYSDLIGRTEVANISGSFVRKTGDTMTGNFGAPNINVSAYLYAAAAGFGPSVGFYNNAYDSRTFLFTNTTGADKSVYLPNASGTIALTSNIPTSATFLSDYDTRYVNITGDTMTGTLNIVPTAYNSWGATLDGRVQNNSTILSVTGANQTNTFIIDENKVLFNNTNKAISRVILREDYAYLNNDISGSVNTFIGHNIYNELTTSNAKVTNLIPLRINGYDGTNGLIVNNDGIWVEYINATTDTSKSSNTCSARGITVDVVETYDNVGGGTGVAKGINVLDVYQGCTSGSAHGLYIENVYNLGTNSLSESNGIYIDNVDSEGPNVFGIQINGAGGSNVNGITYGLFINNDGLFTSGGEVYSIKTEDYDISPRTHYFGGEVRISQNSKLVWSNSAGTSADTNLYRVSSNNLKTDDDLTVAGIAGISGNIVTHDANGKLLDSGVNITTLSQQASGSGLVENIDFFLAAGSNSTVVLRANCKYPFILNDITDETSSGTITGNVRKNGVSVGGLSALSFTTTPTTVNATSNNSFVAGDKLDIVFTSNSGSLNVAGSIKITRV